jgi:hypothetical protein
LVFSFWRKTIVGKTASMKFEGVEAIESDCEVLIMPNHAKKEGDT